jgi:major vault protein
MAEIQSSTQLILAQNQHAFIQDTNKGTVQVFAGPHSMTLSQTDRPVTYDRAADVYTPTTMQQAIRQNPLVPEGHYLVLENPAEERDGKLQTPKAGSQANAVELKIGRKINIPGPATFPLWPGQCATPISGHHLRSNQYLVVRVYNAEEANKNVPESLKQKEAFTPGALLVIKGTEVSFFIPPTGFEVQKDAENNYVREALTLERLEYCVLLDEDGNKRYERGPQVVFPEATERFVVKAGVDDRGKSRVLKAIELNDQMGLYIKVIADYVEPLHILGPNDIDVEEADTASIDGTTWVVKTHKTGDELFITGKEQRIYYPRPEHALIEYKDPTSDFPRQRYYGITIPKGEGRYVLDKTVGDIQKQEGPQIFLPDPRNQVIVRRVLDERTVAMWYPGNMEALAFNQSLRALADTSVNYLTDSVVLNAAADLSRGMNRGTTGNRALSGSFEGAKLQRGSQFTPPPMLTLNNKYEGVPCIGVWTGYAVQVVNKSGERRVVVGPATILLEYDESLEILELSTGKPKTTDTLKRDVYLRVDNNLVSDIVQIETKDLVKVDLKLSYRVNFVREHQDKWFSIENYVKYLCDHLRSRLKAELKKQSITEVMDAAATMVRDVVLGERPVVADPAFDAPPTKRHRFFAENGMDVYDVEVLEVKIADTKIAQLLTTAQSKSVESAITLTSDEQTLINTRRKTTIAKEMEQLATEALLHKQELADEVAKAEAASVMAEIDRELERARVRLEAEVAEQDQLDTVATSAFERDKERTDYELRLETDRVELFAKKMAAIAPGVIEAITKFGDAEMLNKLSIALAPLAVTEQTGINNVMERIFAGTPVETVLKNIKTRPQLERASD